MNTGEMVQTWARIVPAASLEDACASPMDELRGLAYRLMSVDRRGAETVHSIVGSLTAPLQVLVAGRSGVGRSAVTRLIETDDRGPRRIGGAPVIATEMRALDVPGVNDPDLSDHCIVLVVVDAIRDADRRAATRMSDHGMVVVNKADHIGDAWEAAITRAAEISAELATVALPLAALTGRGGEALFGELSRALETSWWRRADGIRSVLECIAAGARVGDIYKADVSRARDAVEQYLCTDSGLIFAATAALVRPDLREFTMAAPALPITMADARACALWWGGPAQREHPAWSDAISVVHRAYVRRWVLLGGEPDAPEHSHE